MPGGAYHGQLHPVHALLGGLDQIEPPLLAHREREPADLADALGDAVEQLAVVVDQVPRPVRTARLLVREEGDHDVARGPAPAAQPVADDRQGHRVHVLHVDRATPPHAPVGDLAGEGVVGPVRRVRRYDVQVAVDEERGPGRVRALDPGHRGRASRVRLEDLRFEAHLGELFGDVLGRLALTRARVVAVVAGVDPDQLAAEVHDLVLAGDALGRVRVAHAASSHCHCWWSCLILSLPRPAPQGRSRPVTRRSRGTGAGRGGDGVIGHPGSLVMFPSSPRGKPRATDTLSGWRNGRRASLRC